MRHILFLAFALTVFGMPAHAQSVPLSGNAPEEKEGDNPCRDQVAEALRKLRKSSWFRLETSMITERGPTEMQVAYVLPDKMHQKVTSLVTKDTSEVVLIGDEAWQRSGSNRWQKLPFEVTQDLRGQMYETVIKEQTEVGNYSCHGRTRFDGRDVLAYKLEDQPAKDSTASRNEAFRMFYVDALTGLPASNVLIVSGREDKPLFKATYSFPLDIRIEPPKDVAETAPPAASPAK